MPPRTRKVASPEAAAAADASPASPRAAGGRRTPAAAAAPAEPRRWVAALTLLLIPAPVFVALALRVTSAGIQRLIAVRS